MKAQALKTIWKDKLRRLASGGRKAKFRLLFFIQHRDISGLNIKMTGIEIRQTFFSLFFYSKFKLELSFLPTRFYLTAESQSYWELRAGLLWCAPHLVTHCNSLHPCSGVVYINSLYSLVYIPSTWSSNSCFDSCHDSIPVQLDEPA